MTNEIANIFSVEPGALAADLGDGSLDNKITLAGLATVLTQRLSVMPTEDLKAQCGTKTPTVEQIRAYVDQLMPKLQLTTGLTDGMLSTDFSLTIKEKRWDKQWNTDHPDVSQALHSLFWSGIRALNGEP